MANKPLLGSLFFIFVVLPSIIMFSVSFKKLQATQVGLDYNHNTKHVDNKVYKSGLYFLGLGHTFLHFPTTYRTLDFEGASTISCFTSDGLPVNISMSFQYKLDTDSVYQLYMAYGESYEKVYQNIAIHQISTVSTKFSAYLFFSEPSTISGEILSALQLALGDLYASVEYFQLKQIDLPQAFEDAIQQTLVAQQAINKAEYQLQSANVQAATMIQNATYQANITVINSVSQATQYLQNQKAVALANANLIDTEATSYRVVQDTLAFQSPDDLLDYIWFEALGEQDSANIYIGMNPEPVMAVKS